MNKNGYMQCMMSRIMLTIEWGRVEGGERLGSVTPKGVFFKYNMYLIVPALDCRHQVQ